MLFIITNKSGSRREFKNNKAKAYKKRIYSNRNILRSELDSDSSLSSDSEWEEQRNPTKRKEINKLDNIVTNNILKKNQHNEAIEYDPKLEIDLFYLAVIRTPYQ